MRLDHLAVACADLDEGAAWAESVLGVPLDAGGRHDRFGTHNRLARLGEGEYLEVVAPDPAAPRPAHPRWFGLDRVDTPRLAAWVARVPDLAAALADAPQGAGERLDLARGTYAWSIAVPPDGDPPWGGAFPHLIEWRAGGHPADALPDRGLRLLALVVSHPSHRTLASRLAPLGPRVAVVPGPPGLRARLATPRGEAWL